MEQAATIGIGLANAVLKLHGLDAEGAALVRRKLRRARALTFPEGPPPRLAGMEARAGAHHWARIGGRARLRRLDGPHAAAGARPAERRAPAACRRPETGTSDASLALARWR